MSEKDNILQSYLFAKITEDKNHKEQFTQV